MYVALVVFVIVGQNVGLREIVIGHLDTKSFRKIISNTKLSVLVSTS
jgi:hypothetical protein